jgi:DNA-directed RNA polymerase subunit beta
MASVIQSNFRVRKNLGRVRRIIEVPNLIDIQKSSYDKFLQTNVPPSQRQEVGLQAVFRSVFPIKDLTGRASSSSCRTTSRNRSTTWTSAASAA